MSDQLATTWLKEASATINETLPPATPTTAEDSTEERPFPISTCPGPLKGMAENAAACLQVPLVLVAMCILGCTSAAIGRGVAVESRRGRQTRANTYWLASAVSGSGKSEVMRVTAGPLRECEKKIRDKFTEQEKPKLQVELDGLKALLKADTAKGAADVAARIVAMKRVDEINLLLVPPQLIVANVTTEKLAQVLRANGETSCSMSGEARDVIKNVLGKYTKGQNATDEGLYLSCYTGEPVSTQRIHSGDTFLESPCLTVLWLVQPDLFMKVAESDSLTDGGLLPRFNIAHTDAKRQKQTGEEPELNPLIVGGYNAVLEALIKAYRLGGGETHVIKPDEDAVLLMRDYHNSTIRDDGAYSGIESYVSRWVENAWRISVVLHCAEHGASAHKHSLSGDVAARAIAIQQWFAEEQMNLLSVGRLKKRQERKDRILKVIETKFAADKKPVTERMIRLSTGLDYAEIRPAVSDLLGATLISEVKHKSATGPATTAYEPKLTSTRF